MSSTVTESSIALTRNVPSTSGFVGLLSQSHSIICGVLELVVKLKER